MWKRKDRGRRGKGSEGKVKQKQKEWSTRSERTGVKGMEGGCVYGLIDGWTDLSFFFSSRLHGRGTGTSGS